MKAATTMIKHIVMWNVRGATAQERLEGARLIKRLFEALHGQVPGLLKIEIGINVTPVDYACDVVLYSEFADEPSLSAYASHPAHLAVRQQLGDLRTARHQVDYSA
jgi:hypothetical protein